MKIDEKTHINLYAALASIPFLIGGIVWLTTIDGKAQAAQEELNRLRPIVQEIRERVIRIDEELKVFVKQNK